MDEEEDYGTFLHYTSIPEGGSIRNRPKTPQVHELRTCTPGAVIVRDENGLSSSRTVPMDEEDTPLLMETKKNVNHDKNMVSEGSGSGYLKDSSSTSSTESVSSTWKTVLRNIKIYTIFALVIFFSFVIAVTPDAQAKEEYFSISEAMGTIKINFTGCTDPEIKLIVEGAFEDRHPQEGYDNLTFSAREGDATAEKWVLVLQRDYYIGEIVEKKFVFDLDKLNGSVSSVDVSAKSTNSYPFPFSLKYICHPEQINQQVIYAGAVLAFVYVLIIFELVHRTIAAMLGALAALAILSLLNERPSYDTLVSWIDYETLTLLLGMMILVSVFCETGFFDWAAFQAYKITKGNVWGLITILCFFAAIVSAFLDNVTTMLLMTPVTIRLCEVLNLDPRYVLIAEVIFSNVGGAATAVGDPPNVIIVSNADASRKGVDFNTFTSHLALGVIFILIGTYALLRLMFMNMSKLKNTEPKEIMELKHEIEIWRRACNRITVATREESMVKALLMQKVVTLETLLQNRKSQIKGIVIKDFEESLLEMKSKYRIRDKVLLVKTGIVLSVVIVLFFLSSFIEAIRLSLGWIAILGAMWLLVLSDFHDLETILDKVEWATLMFFAALFILMEALSEMGLMDWIGSLIASWIEAVNEQDRLAVAIILILWVSALASSFIDNIPFTTAMVPVLIQLGEDPKLNLPFMPLVWALAFGTCLGGNGTLIGASANVVCAGIAEQHGYGFSFVQFFKIGFPMMLMTVCMAMVYLLICHCTPIAWNYS
ncbi:P protein-like [Lineus longissimus]|uniref:P protein-like n=1 Tax=Lineus longissimus TaxID=88925 RepID=UPI002B4F4905